MHPDQPLRCLLIQPKFSEDCYWNYVSVCNLVGAKAVQPPLGLLTAAAILPQHWEFRLVDLNVRPLLDEEWEWADLIATGGMCPQQTGILEVIRRAKRDGKRVVVGGPDPTVQVDVYQEADAIVMGEGEVTIPLWLESWRNGLPAGRFESPDKPDMTKSPLPRFDLISFDDYIHIGIQYSRGCPFNCEFCDIIEIYGRVPRTKSTPQILAEFQRVYDLGYRGWVDLVDDNFVGNKRNVKQMLPELETWCRQHGYPYFFSTEASMNLADDEDLMRMMQAVDFRWIFTGIETPDPELLRSIQKKQNAHRPVVERIHRIYEHGLGVAAGFILGFDGEQDGTDNAIVGCIEAADIIFSLVGLLLVCPKTQLADRLRREGRLLTPEGELVPPDGEGFRVTADGTTNEHFDTSTVGLNFVTTRDRAKILEEFANVIRTVYTPEIYFRRVVRATRHMNIRRRHRPRGKELWRFVRGGWRAALRLSRNPRTRKHFWKAALQCLVMGPRKLEYAMMAMSFFLHFDRQTAAMLKETEQRRKAEVARARRAGNATLRQLSFQKDEADLGDPHSMTAMRSARRSPIRRP